MEPKWLTQALLNKITSQDLKKCSKRYKFSIPLWNLFQAHERFIYISVT